MKTGLLKRKKLAGGLGLLLALALVFTLGGSVMAQPPQQPADHQFAGDVSLCGTPFTDITVDVVATIDDAVVDWTGPIAADGTYGYLPGPAFLVPADNPATPEKDGGEDGDTVNFWVNGKLGGQATWETDGFDIVDLLVTEVDLTINSTTGGEVTDPGEGVFPYDCGDDVPLFAEPDTGFEFVNWTDASGAIDDPGSADTSITDIDGFYEITANFVSVEPHDLTVTSEGCCSITVEGLGTVDPSTTDVFEDIPFGTEIELEAIPPAFCVFDGWEVDGAPVGGNPIIVSMESDHTAVATCFSLESHDLTVTSDGCCSITVEGLGTVDPGATDVFGDIPYGTDVELQALPPDCCDFDGWEVDGAPVGGNPIIVSMESDHTAVAICSEVGLLTLDIDVMGSGDVEVNGVAPADYPETYFFDCCTYVGLEAIPDADWFFAGWSGDLTGIVNPITIHMDEDYDIIAIFEPIEPTVLTIDSTEGGEVTDPGEGVFPYPGGTLVPLVAEPTPCSTFVNWTGDVGTIDDPNAAETYIIMNDDYDITANFDLPEILMEIYIGPDWNTFATPIALNTCCDTWDELLALSGLIDDVVQVYYYDGATQHWGPVFTGHHDEVKPLEGFFIQLDPASMGGWVPIIPHPESPVPPSKQVYTGANLVGPAPASLADETVVFNLASIYEAEGGLRGYTMVISPPVNADGWDAYIRDGSDPPLMRIGNSYWTIMDNPDVLWGSSTTPLTP